jgi:myosin-5
MDRMHTEFVTISRMSERKAYFLKKELLLQAADSRDALAKAIYDGLFEWLVERINESLGFGELHEGRSITILDIYGFESFEVRKKKRIVLPF